MSLLARKLGGYETLNKFFSKLEADHPRSQDKHVHVIVLDSLMRRIRVVAETGADSGDFISRNRGANTTAAH